MLFAVGIYLVKKNGKAGKNWHSSCDNKFLRERKIPRRKPQVCELCRSDVTQIKIMDAMD